MTPILDNSPFVTDRSSVRSVMLRVVLALVPAICAYVVVIGPVILVQLALATLACLMFEATMLAARGKPVWRFVSDGSAILTAWLIALSLPPTVPWWLMLIACFAAIVVAKHLYGGLGQNPFNPAMVGFALMIVAYPQLMSKWPAPGAPLAVQVDAILGRTVLDAMTSATPLDALRTAWHSGGAGAIQAVMADPDLIGAVAGRGWEWVALAYLPGGLFLLQQRLISWHMPTAFLATLAGLATGFHALDGAQFAGPALHLLSGGALLAAFFIVTDPVSGCTTARGKLIFGAGIGLVTWVIRSFGAYPDGIAFGVLLFNIAAPLIDRYTQPPVFGHKEGPRSSS